MGSFLTGIHARTSSIGDVATAVTPLLAEPGLVAASGSGWVTAVLDGASLQDPDRLAEAASGLALELGAPTVGFSVYDSDVLTLVLAREDGKTAVVRTEAGVEADPEDVARFADGAAALPETADGVAERLRGLLESPSPGFEEERLAAVDGLLGIDESISGHSVDSLLDALDAGEVSAEVREVRPRAASEAEAELFRAIEKGDDEAVREALQGGADPDARAGGRRALERALQINHMPSVHRLLEAGARPDMDDVTRAINLENAALLQAMLDAGFDVDAVHPRYGYTALYLAVHLERRRSVDVLLSAGADVDRRFDLWEGMGGTRGATALWGATSPQVLDALLEAGADPDPADERGVTPLMLTALTRLGGERCWALTKRLLEAGADAEARTKDGKSVVELLELQIEVYEGAVEGEWSECRALARELEESLDIGSGQDTVEALREAPPGHIRTSVSGMRELAELFRGI